MRMPIQITQLGQLGWSASSHGKMVNVPPNPDPNNLTEKVSACHNTALTSGLAMTSSTIPNQAVDDKNSVAVGKAFLAVRFAVCGSVSGRCDRHRHKDEVVDGRNFDAPHGAAGEAPEKSSKRHWRAATYSPPLYAMIVHTILPWVGTRR